MTRLPLALTGLGLSAALAAGGVVVPVPRVPASALTPAPMPDDPAAEPEDPSAIADRIAENTKKAGDQLAEFNTGDDTRTAQEQVLKDIDKLLNQPPMDGGGGGGSDQQSQNNQNDQSQSGGIGQAGGQQPNAGGGVGRRGSSGGGGGQRKSGGGGQSAGRQARQQRREQRQQAGAGQQPGGGQQTAQKNGQPMPMGGSDPMPAGQGGPEKQQAAGGNDPTQPGGAAGGQGGRGTPALPLDDAITKQVWGHLPERLRQQMSQYYREQFMPKYGELLQEYYSSLAEREKAGRK